MGRLRRRWRTEGACGCDWGTEGVCKERAAGGGAMLLRGGRLSRTIMHEGCRVVQWVPKGRGRGEGAVRVRKGDSRQQWCGGGLVQTAGRCTCVHTAQHSTAQGGVCSCRHRATLQGPPGRPRSGLGSSLGAQPAALATVAPCPFATGVYQCLYGITYIYICIVHRHHSCLTWRLGAFCVVISRCSVGER